MSLLVSPTGVTRAAGATEAYALAGPYPQLLTDLQIADSATGVMALGGSSVETWSAPPDLKAVTHITWEDIPRQLQSRIVLSSAAALMNSDAGSGTLALTGSAVESTGGHYGAKRDPFWSGSGRGGPATDEPPGDSPDSKRDPLWDP